MPAAVRYIVDDVSSAIDFYRLLGFEVTMHPAPGFAAMRRDELQLLLNAPGSGGAGQPSDHGPQAGSMPRPGGWNRFQIAVVDLDAEVERLRGAEVTIRTGITEGRGGRQAVVDDPSGNPVELFEPPTSTAP